MMDLQPDDRLTRTRWVIEGLSVGDAFGDRLFFQGFSRYGDSFHAMIQERILPSPLWEYTDDTQMSLSIVEVLRKYGVIDQDALANSFATRFERRRGYGPAMYKLIPQLQMGLSWQVAARSLFNGQGSFGNGSAMRVPPVGAYFADDLDVVAENALLSAQVTHAHLEAGAGAIAVAIATAIACQYGTKKSLPRRKEFIDLILPYIPESQVRLGIIKASELPSNIPVTKVILEIGNGTGVTAQDTVPFVLWCAGQSLGSYAEAMWLTASGFGDIDTNCAMVGGIVAGYVGLQGIPDEWLRFREELPKWPFMDEV
jgi:ADP-ribosylglycohydrolase